MSDRDAEYTEYVAPGCRRCGGWLRVYMNVFGRHPVLGVVSLFAHHLLLLGPNPARWARVPIDRPVRLG